MRAPHLPAHLQHHALVDVEARGGDLGVVSNREFTQTFAKHLRRPVVWSAPQWLMRALVGKDRASILLEGQSVVPKRTLESGYRFRYAALDGAMTDLVQITF